MKFRTAFFLIFILLTPLHLAGAEEVPYQEVNVDQKFWGIPAREIWSQTALTDYAYTLEQQCYCTLPAKSRVYIANNKVLAVKDLSTNHWLKKDLNNFKTINQLFDFIDEIVSKKPDSHQVVLDKHLGFPTLVEINPRYRTADDEINFRISDLKSLKKQSE